MLENFKNIPTKLLQFIHLFLVDQYIKMSKKAIWYESWKHDHQTIVVQACDTTEI